MGTLLCNFWPLYGSGFAAAWRLTSMGGWIGHTAPPNPNLPATLTHCGFRQLTKLTLFDRPRHECRPRLLPNWSLRTVRFRCKAIARVPLLLLIALSNV